MAGQIPGATGSVSAVTGRPYRPYQSQQPLGPSGADVQFGIRQGMNAISPTVSQGLQQAHNPQNPQAWMQQQGGTNDAFRNLLQQGMASRGYQYNPAQTAYEMDRFFTRKT